MQHKPTHRPEEAHTIRLAWWAAFLTTLVLLISLGVVRSAEAAVIPPSLPGPLGTLAIPGAVEAEEEDEGEEPGDESEEEEIEAAECEAAEEEGEECEVDLGPPPECFLTSADAAVSADLGHDKLHLALRYTSRSPVTVAVDYFSRGNKGPLNLEGGQQHFGRSGVFRLTQSLTDAQAKKVAATKTFTVTVDPASSPRSCGEYLDQHLSVKRPAPGGSTWVDTESTFRRARRH